MAWLAVASSVVVVHVELFISVTGKPYKLNGRIICVCLSTADCVEMSSWRRLWRLKVNPKIQKYFSGPTVKLWLCPWCWTLCDYSWRWRRRCYLQKLSDAVSGAYEPKPKKLFLYLDVGVTHARDLYKLCDVFPKLNLAAVLLNVASRR